MVCAERRLWRQGWTRGCLQTRCCLSLTASSGCQPCTELTQAEWSSCLLDIIKRVSMLDGQQLIFCSTASPPVLPEIYEWGTDCSLGLARMHERRHAAGLLGDLHTLCSLDVGCVQQAEKHLETVCSVLACTSSVAQQMQYSFRLCRFLRFPTVAARLPKSACPPATMYASQH